MLPATPETTAKPETFARSSRLASLSITVVVPTYREVENIPHLIERLQRVRDASDLDIELLIMDDDSRDGSEELVESLHIPWVRLVTRRTNRSLSGAVLEGLRLSRRDIAVVMDADLSHPPEKIPEMVAALQDGADVVVGSRFVKGGSTAHDWGIFRWLNSRVAAALARPLVNLSDPMSGFFALRRKTLETGCNFKPIGYKILLELIVKCRCKRVVEVAIHFDNRRFGKSKLSAKEQLRYIQHLRLLYIHKYGTWSHLAQFLVVGASGAVINLATLTLLIYIDIAPRVAIALAIVVAMLWNFALNRRFSFSYARTESIRRQFVGFVAACSVGAAVNFLCTIALWNAFEIKQLAAIVGILAGTSFNFLANRYLVFRKTHVRT